MHSVVAGAGLSHLASASLFTGWDTTISLTPARLDSPPAAAPAERVSNDEIQARLAVALEAQYLQHARDELDVYETVPATGGALEHFE